MKQYPHTIEVFKTAASTQDTNGNWTTASSEWEDVSVCRDQPNGEGKTIPGEDGVGFIYQAIVFLPKGAVPIANRDKVRVKDSSGSIRLQGIVKRISFDQLHTRIWL